MKGFSFTSNSIVNILKEDLEKYEIEEVNEIDQEVLDFIEVNGWEITNEFENYMDINEGSSALLLSGVNEYIVVFN